jgi:hypothetical protein
MKMEQKLSAFSAEKQKWNGNMEMETEFCGTEFFGGSGKGNRTIFSSGTGTEIKFPCYNFSA